MAIAPRLAFLCGILIVGGNLLSGVDATTLDDPTGTLTAGATAEYSVLTVNSASLVRIVLTVPATTSSCEDGFGRPFACLPVEVEYGPQGRSLSEIAELSTTHAALLSVGGWHLDGTFDQQLFAAETPLWPAYPLEREVDGRVHRALRLVLLGALELGPRAATGSIDSTTFSNVATLVQVDHTPAGMTVTAVFKDAWNGAAYTYTVRYEPQDALPSRLELLQDGATLATATRVQYTAGSTALPLAGWAPLDFPSVRPGLERSGWTTVPPSRGDSVLLPPLADAAEIAGLSPLNILQARDHPQSYVVQANYRENGAVAHAPGIQQKDALWDLHQADGSNQSRTVRVERSTLFAQTDDESVPPQRIDRDSFEELPLRAPITSYVAPRASLPETLVTVEDAFLVAQESWPLGASRFGLGWRAATSESLLDTADAGVYVLSCAVMSPTMEAWVSAVNGQLLSRLTWGTTACP